MKVDRFEDLIAWQKGRELVKRIYAATENGRIARDFALRRQIRSASLSVPANIAEGFERTRPREFHQFLSIAKASCAEVRTYLYIAGDVGYLEEGLIHGLLAQAAEVGKVIGGLRKSVAAKLREVRLSTQHSALSTLSRC